MPLLPRRWKHPFTLSLLVSGVLACTGIMENEFDCENAVAHLESCCAYADARYVSCTQTHGCDATGPDLDVALSQCIQAQSCNALQTSGACSGDYSICGEPPAPAPAPSSPDPGGSGGWSSSGFTSGSSGTSSSGGDDGGDEGEAATDDGSGGEGGEARADDAPAGDGEQGDGAVSE